ncbi:hypothetical protein [Thiobacillus sp.]
MFDWLKKKSTMHGPDYSKIDSREKAERLAAEGELTKLHLLPPEFGGDDAPPNIVYVRNYIQGAYEHVHITEGSGQAT